MTNRHAGYIVALDHNLREDDAENITNAIKMLKGVLSVQPVEGDHVVAIAEQRAWHRIWTQWGDMLVEERDKRGQI